MSVANEYRRAIRVKLLIQISSNLTLFLKNHWNNSNMFLYLYHKNNFSNSPVGLLEDTHRGETKNLQNSAHLPERKQNRLVWIIPKYHSLAKIGRIFLKTKVTTLMLRVADVSYNPESWGGAGSILIKRRCGKNSVTRLIIQVYDLI